MVTTKIIEAEESSPAPSEAGIKVDPRTDYQKRFSQARKDGHFTIKQVADEMGLTVQALSQFELGKSSISLVNFLKACDVLGVRTEWVLHGTGRTWTRSAPVATPVRKRAATRKQESTLG